MFPVYGPATPADEISFGSVIQGANGQYYQAGEGAPVAGSVAPLTLASIPMSWWLIGGAVLFGFSILMSGGRR